MGVDLSIEINHLTLEAMEKHWTQSTWIRNLGASVIGHECNKYIWLNWRYAIMPDFPPRVLRLFDRGHREEETMIAELKTAGVTVWGEQDDIFGYKRHFVAHPDGFAKGILEAPETEHLLEFKTMSEKNFIALQGKGVEKAQPKHYAQMQIQMHLTGLTRAFYLVVNKNNDELYAERVYYNKDYSEALQKKIEMIIDIDRPPEPNVSWTCRWCDMRGLCDPEKYPEAKQMPQLNCRTCVFSTPAEGGTWQCSKFNGDIPKEFQLKGCDKHLLIPGIIPVDVVSSDGETYVEYADGRLNINEDYVTNGDNVVHESFQHGTPF